MQRLRIPGQRETKLKVRVARPHVSLRDLVAHPLHEDPLPLVAGLVRAHDQGPSLGRHGRGNRELIARIDRVVAAERRGGELSDRHPPRAHQLVLLEPLTQAVGGQQIGHAHEQYRPVVAGRLKQPPRRYRSRPEPSRDLSRVFLEQQRGALHVVGKPGGGRLPLFHGDCVGELRGGRAGDDRTFVEPEAREHLVKDLRRLEHVDVALRPRGALQVGPRGGRLRPARNLEEHGKPARRAEQVRVYGNPFPFDGLQP